jgi:hypothetical protein
MSSASVLPALGPVSSLHFLFLFALQPTLSFRPFFPFDFMTHFQRQGWAVPVSNKASDFRAGDVVAWDLGGGVTHIGIVSDRRSAKGTPLVIHNIGRGTQEEDILFQYEIIGHYRPLFGPARSKPTDSTVLPHDQLR